MNAPLETTDLRRHRRWMPGTGLAVAFLALSACAPATIERVVLLPQADAAGSAVEVRSGEAVLLLDGPYQVAAVGARQILTRQNTTAEAVARDYPWLLTLQALPPARFTLGFEPGGTLLTPESASELTRVIEQVRAREGAEILVVGHTDRQGAAEDNDRLSLTRAEAIKALLVQQGVDADLIEAIGRGEREPLIPTEDGVAEPRNRRAEIIVR
jgi:OOP family OmpA-OmpF porin